MLVGLETSDDAGVYQLDEETALVQTVDFFTPIVDDPFQFGQIAVVNVVETQRGVDALKTTQVFGEVGHTYGFKAGALEPFANIAYVRVDGGVNETGMAAMTGSATLDTTYTTLVLRGCAASSWGCEAA